MRSSLQVQPTSPPVTFRTRQSLRRRIRLRLGTLSAVAHPTERSELATGDRVRRGRGLRTGSRRHELWIAQSTCCGSSTPNCTGRASPAC